jgi:DNA-binding MarR family transcriptional regulator
VRLVGRRDELRAIDLALQQIMRISQGRRAAQLRSSRAGLDLSRPGVAILAALNAHGPLRTTRLAERADTEAAVVSRELRVLSAQGYVATGSDPTDHRARVVSLTDAGRAAFGRYRTAIDAIIAETFSGWTTAELQALRASLARVADDFARPRATPPPA